MSKIVGITGGIGSGKTTVAKLFEAKGVPVFYADQAAKKLMQTDDALKDEIIKLLGSKAYHKDESLNREYIAQKIFNHPNLREALNALVHPAVRKYFKRWASLQTTKYCMYEAAILIESGGAAMCDYIILVTAPEALRIDRVEARDQSSQAAVKIRIQAQLSEAEKSKYADAIIENIDLKVTVQNVDELHRYLMQKF
ncbi:MAG: dephospho-CoA kinase [Flavobacteriaceae bacterium]|nr:dephospho-CoA kinase [Flavobacteriaceae bacterium]